MQIGRVVHHRRRLTTRVAQLGRQPRHGRHTVRGHRRLGPVDLAKHGVHHPRHTRLDREQISHQVQLFTIREQRYVVEVEVIEQTGDHGGEIRHRRPELCLDTHAINLSVATDSFRDQPSTSKSRSQLIEWFMKARLETATDSFRAGQPNRRDSSKLTTLDHL